VLASGTLTLSGSAAGNTAIINGVTLTDVDHRDTTNITLTADTAGSLNSKFFIFQDQSAAHKYYVWYNINGAGVDPAPASRTGIMVAGATNASAATLALATVAAAAALPTVNVTLTSGASGHVIVTNNAAGVATAVADGSAPTSFTFTHTITGSAVSSVQYEQGFTDAETAANLSAAIAANTSINPFVTSVVKPVGGTPGAGPLAPVMGAAATYAAIASSTITNTGSTTITGSLALSPGTSVTGAPTVSGSSDVANTAAANAQVAATSIYNYLAALPSNENLSGQNLGGMTLAPGVYTFNTSAQLTGTLTLHGGANDTFVFQIGSTLTAASAASVVLTGGAQAGNVFWQVGSSATLGTTSVMKGIIVALASITFNTGATITGAAMARTGAITFDTNTDTLATPTNSPSSVVTLTAIAPGIYGNMTTISGTGGVSASGARLTGGAAPTTVSALNTYHLGF